MSAPASSRRREASGASSLVVLVGVAALAGFLAWAVVVALSPRGPELARVLHCSIERSLDEARGAPSGRPCAQAVDGIGTGGVEQPGGSGEQEKPDAGGRPPGDPQPDEGKPEKPDEGAAAAVAKTVPGCDPFSGKPVERSVADILNPKKNVEGTVGYTSPGRDDVIGALYTASCEPTSTTGDGSCFLSEKSTITVIDVAPEFPLWAFGDLGSVGPKFSIVFVLLQQEMNSGKTDYLTFFMLVPSAMIKAGKVGVDDPRAVLNLSYTKAWFALYRILNDAENGDDGNARTQDPDKVFTKLASPGGQVRALGGATDSYGNSLLPFMTGQFNGGGASLQVNAQGGDIRIGGQNWIGDFAIDTTLADPVAASRPPQDPQKTLLPGDLFKIQPDPLFAAAFLKGTPLSRFVVPLKATGSSGIEFDQLDVASVKAGPNGTEQLASMEMVLRVPLAVALKFAAPGEQLNRARAHLGTLPGPVRRMVEATVRNWDSVRRDPSKLGEIKAGPYMAMRYTKKVDIADLTPPRTPDAPKNLALWRKVKQSGGWDLKALAELFAPSGAAALQMYFGGEFGGSTGKVMPKVAGLSLQGAVRRHSRALAWHVDPNPPDTSTLGSTWKLWDSCMNQTTANPRRFPYGEALKEHFTPGTDDVLEGSASPQPGFAGQQRIAARPLAGVARSGARLLAAVLPGARRAVVAAPSVGPLRAAGRQSLLCRQPRVPRGPLPGPFQLPGLFPLAAAGAGAGIGLGLGDDGGGGGQDGNGSGGGSSPGSASGSPSVGASGSPSVGASGSPSVGASGSPSDGASDPPGADPSAPSLSGVDRALEGPAMLDPSGLDDFTEEIVQHAAQAFARRTGRTDCAGAFSSAMRATLSDDQVGYMVLRAFPTAERLVDAVKAGWRACRETLPADVASDRALSGFPSEADGEVAERVFGLTLAAQQARRAASCGPRTTAGCTAPTDADRLSLQTADAAVALRNALSAVGIFVFAGSLQERLEHEVMEHGRTVPDAVTEVAASLARMTSGRLFDPEVLGAVMEVYSWSYPRPSDTA